MTGITFFGHGRIPAAERTGIEAAIQSALGRSWLPGSNGSVGTFESALAAYVDRPHVVGSASGSAALAAALHVLTGHLADDELEVITTSYTFAATVMPAVRRGLRVTVVDIDPESLLADEDALTTAIESTTRRPVLVPVHLNGMSHECPQARAVARARDGFIIDDAAQRLARSLPADSDAWCFSLGPTKNIMGVVEAGAIAVRDDETAARLRLYIRNGNAGGMIHLAIGDNLQLDAVGAAVLTHNLALLDDWDQRRAAVAERYRATLPGTVTVIEHPGGSVFHKMPILIGDRDAVVERMARRGIDLGVHYPLSLPDQPAFRDVVRSHRGPPRHAQYVARHVATLPVHPWLTAADVEHIAAVLTQAQQGFSGEPTKMENQR